MAGDELVESLVRQAAAGDERAFGALVRQFYHQIHRWALVMAGDADEADDVTQEVLLRLYRYLPGYRGRARFSTWLYQVTRSAALGSLRRRVRRRLAAAGLARWADPVLEGETDPAAALDAARAADLVRTFFSELPPRQREVFDLADLKGFAPAEIAELLDMKPVTVRAHLFKARRAIRSRILERSPGLVEGTGS
ncbi:MAG: RNA polymerase sigma factor [Gemmatimonadetes bacterium]|nr:RNA polymerase sigma factor [Gemmatimonadota bacterium]